MNETDNGIGIEKCGTCLKGIPRGAKKCTNCDSYQDWRRHLPAGTAVLSLLVALGSVLTVLVPVLSEALTYGNSKFISGMSKPIMNFDSYTREIEIRGFDVVLSNVGNRTGTLSHFSLFVGDERQLELEMSVYDEATFEFKSANTLLIEPQKSKLVRVTFQGDTLRLMNVRGPKAPTKQMDAYVVNFNGTSNSITILDLK
jgi:hypothetical protein